MRTPEGKVIFIDQMALVFFESGSARVDERGAAILDAFAGYVQAPPHCHLIIVGHADRVGPDGANLELSRRRAKAVEAYLRARGVTVPITIGAHGDTRPLVETAEGTAEPRNRRVELYVG
ncbi:MAG TPA: OmpA family protein [Allosphingosinicella sp.]|jgi:outer membrane protein OmpA-like peptidoglycan-associated protein